MQNQWSEMRGCKGRKLGCVNGCVRLDCIFLFSFLCVFFIFNLVFQTLATQKSFEVLRSFMFALFHGTDRHSCMLYIFSFSTRQDPCALALLGEFRTKHCMLSNHETILSYIVYVYTYTVYISHRRYTFYHSYIHTYESI